MRDAPKASALARFVKHWRNKWGKVAFGDRIAIMVAASSLTVGVLAVILTVVTLRVSKRQELLGAKQADLAARQTQLGEIQMQLMQEQLERSAPLRVKINRPYESELRMRIAIENTGLATSRVRQANLRFSKGTYIVRCEHLAHSAGMVVNNNGGEKVVGAEWPEPLVIPSNNSREVFDCLFELGTEKLYTPFQLTWEIESQYTTFRNEGPAVWLGLGPGIRPMEVIK